MDQKITTHVTKGIIISLILIIADLVGHFTGVRFETWFGISIAIISLGLFIWPPIQYSIEMKNNVTFGNLFSHGFKTTAVFISISFIYFLLVVYVIFPNFVDQLIQMQMDKAQKSGQTIPTLTEDQMATARKFTTGFFMAGVVFINLIIGIIGSLIGAAIAKKKPQDPFGNQAV